MAKVKFFELKTLMVGLKSIGSSIVTSLTLILFYLLQMFLISKGLIGVAAILGLLIMVAGVMFFGFYSRLFWNWK